MQCFRLDNSIMKMKESIVNMSSRVNSVNSRLSMYLRDKTPLLQQMRDFKDNYERRSDLRPAIKSDLKDLTERSDRLKVVDSWYNKEITDLQKRCKAPEEKEEEEEKKEKEEAEEKEEGEEKE